MNAQETADVRCPLWALAIIVLAAIAGCSSGSASSTSPGPTTVGSVPAAITVVSSPSSAAPTTAAASSTSSSSASSTTSTEATTTTVDPTAPAACTLLSAAEVGFITGNATVFRDGVAEEAQETPYGAHTACLWTASTDPGISVRVSVWDDDSAFDAAKAQLGSTGDVSGVGDRAFSTTLASIYAVAGGNTLFVQFANLDQDDATNLPFSTTIAQLAASRL